MEVSLGFSSLLPRSESKPPKPNTELIKKRLLRKGVVPTPKIIHTIRKKELQKSLRRSKKETLTLNPDQNPNPSASDDSISLLKTISAEYRAVRDQLELRGRPWEGAGVADLSTKEGFGGGKLKGEYLEELRGVLEERNAKGLRWILDDGDLEERGESAEEEGGKRVIRLKEGLSEDEKIKLLVKRLNTTNLSIQDWKFSRVMKQSGIIFSELHLLEIVRRLGVMGNWRQALSVVEWVYSQRDYEHHKSRFVYTKLLSVLGKARRPHEASQTFNLMRDDGKLYPDMAAYHAIAVVLGQAGLVNELINVIECMRQKPSKRIKNMKRKDWNPCLEPDVVIYNSVLNACVPCHQWKGVSWVLQQMRLGGLRPTETTYGLAMEVMLKAGKYDRVHKYFETMKRGGLATKALTYKVLVRTFKEEGKVDEAVEAVREMECRGVVGTASVYYELACCLCNNGRWQEAMMEVEKLKRLPRTKPMEVSFTGMILSSLDGGHVSDCISIFECMKDYCTPNIGAINAMLKVYGCNDMFAKAKELFEFVKGNISGFGVHLGHDMALKPDEYSYSSMLEASASAHQWEYFESVYKEMALCGFQLDQNKYARLLVEASRAGKWHLLEHAFDAILEAEEVPDMALFTEIICRTISQQNFEKVVSLVNGMAYASMQVSENQWTNLFLRNKDRLNKDELNNLLNYLDDSSNLVMEEPVVSFLRSLQFLCGRILSDNTLVLPAPKDVSGDNLTSHVSADVENCAKIQVHLPQPGVGDDVFAFTCVDNTSCSGSMDNRLQEPDDEAESSSSIIGNRGRESNFVLDGYSDTSSDSTLDLLTANISSPLSKVPSASEILETWKDKRIKDGLFPF